MIFEAVPPELLPALPALGQLAALLFIVGCIYVIHFFVMGLFGAVGRAVGWIPWSNRVLQLPLHRIEQKISHALGTAERAIDARIATAWHTLASHVRRLAADTAAAARLDWQIVSHLVGKLSIHDFWLFLRRALIPLQVQGHRARQEAHTAQRTAHVATHTATHAEKGAQVVAAQAASLSSRFWRSRVNSRLQREALSIARLWRYVRGRGRALPAGLAVGAVAWALGRIGVNWIRCSNVKRIGRRLCGPSGRWLADLLEGTLATFVFADLCRVILLVSEVAGRVLPPLIETLAQAEAALCGGRYAAAPPLPVATTALPDVANPLPLG